MNSHILLKYFELTLLQLQLVKMSCKSITIRLSYNGKKKGAFFNKTPCSDKVCTDKTRAHSHTRSSSSILHFRKCLFDTFGRPAKNSQTFFPGDQPDPEQLQQSKLLKRGSRKTYTMPYLCYKHLSQSRQNTTCNHNNILPSFDEQKGCCRRHTRCHRKSTMQMFRHWNSSK